MSVNVGVANYAAWQGVPTGTVSWIGRSGTTRSAVIFTSLDKTALADESDTRDSAGEIQAERTRNDRLQFRFAAKPVGASAAAALAVLGDLPKKNSAVTFALDAAEADAAVAGTNLVKDVSTAYLNEGEGMINMTVVKHVGKTLAALS